MCSEALSLAVLPSLLVRKVGNGGKALELFERMPGESVRCIAITYSAAVSACEKGKQWLQALKLFERMLSESVPRNIITYNAAISTFERGEQ